MDDDGEPVSRGQLDRPAAEARALQDTLFFVGLFAGAVLVNGILAILFIALTQALGLWGQAGSEAASLDELRSSLQALMRPTSATIA